MAHTLDTSAKFPAAANSTDTSNPVGGANGFTYTCGANATIVAIGLIYGGSVNRAGGAPTYGGVTMTQANTVQRAVTSPEVSTECWYLGMPGAGAKAVVIPNSGALAIDAFLASFNAAANFYSVLDVANGTNNTSANVSVSVATSANGDVVFGVACSGLTNFVTGASANTGTEIDKEDIGAFGGGAQYILQGSSGTATIGWTTGSDDWGAIAVAFKEAAMIVGTCTQTLGDLTLSATGTVESGINGTLAVTLGSATLAGTGGVEIHGAANPTFDAATLAANGTGPYFLLANSTEIPANGTANTTAQLTSPANKTTNDFQAGNISDDTNPLAAFELAANKYTELEFSFRPSNTATAANTTYNFRIVTYGVGFANYTVTPQWTISDVTREGILISTLADLTLAATAAVEVRGTLSATLDAATLAATAGVEVRGMATPTLAAATLTATAGVEVHASLTKTLDDATLTATGTVGTVGINGSLSQTLDACILAATGTIDIAGTVGVTLAAATLAATAGVEIHATASATLADATLAANGVVGATNGTLNITLANATLSATGQVRVAGALTTTLGAATLFASTGPPFRLSASTNIAANATEITTGQLTAPAGKTIAADFQAGRISDDTNPLPAVDLITNRYTELEFNLIATNATQIGSTYHFRITANGTALDTYSQIPAWLVLQVTSGILAKTLDDCTLAASGSVSSSGGITGQLFATLGNATLAATGSVSNIIGTLTVTLNSLNQLILSWTWTQGAPPNDGAVEEWHFYFGPTSQNYTVLKILNDPAARSVPIQSVSPGGGPWYCVIRASNTGYESDPSNEIFIAVPQLTATITPVTPAGQLNATLADATLLAFGRLRIGGSVATTLDALTAVATGKTDINGSIVITLDALTTTATGTVSLSGTTNVTLGAVTTQATAAVEVRAAATATLANATVAATAAVATPGNLGQAYITLADCALSATGAIQVSGSDASTLADASVSANATVRVAGTAAVTLANVTLAATGAAPPDRSATLNVTLGNVTLLGAGTTQGGVTAWADALLASVQLSMQAQAGIAAQVNAILANTMLTATSHIGPVSATRSINVLVDESELICRS